MANHPSAEKRNRQSIKRRAINRMTRASVRTTVKRVQTKIDEGDVEGAKAVFRDAERALTKAATKGIYHHRNASRRVSRLAKAISKAKAKKK